MRAEYLPSVKKQFEYYKALGDKTFLQLPDDALFWQYNEECNSIAMIVQHLWGNMRSRWTDFLTTDGEKEWRNREEEFEPLVKEKQELLAKWQEGWHCLFDGLSSLTEDDLSKIIYIRNEGHTVIEAINRQLAHYPYHIGQIVYLGKMICNTDWKSLSIPKGESKKYNEDKFSKPRQTRHFTDQYLNDEEK